jgi:hypothetical protein
MRAAAYRHLQAAETLFDGHRKDVSGYLYGWASECALKALMIESGMRPLAPDRRREDPFYAHFAELKTMLRDRAFGRRHGDIRKFAADPRFMQFWDTSMRYSDGKDVPDQWVERWREDAKAILAELF